MQDMQTTRPLTDQERKQFLSSNAYGFPSDLAPAAIKNHPEYGVRIAKVIEREFRNGFSQYRGNRNRVVELDMLAAGALRTDFYDEVGAKAADITAAPSDAALAASELSGGAFRGRFAQKRNLAFIPSLVRAVVGVLHRRKLAPSIEALDASALASRKERELKLRAIPIKKKLGADVSRDAIEMGMDVAELPSTDQEARQMALEAPSFEDVVRTAERVRLHMEETRFDEVLRIAILNDLVVRGMAIAQYKATDDGRVKPRRVDLFHCIFNPDFFERGITYFAEKHAYTIPELRDLFADDITAEEWQKLEAATGPEMGSGYGPPRNKAGQVEYDSLSQQSLLDVYEFRVLRSNEEETYDPLTLEPKTAYRPCYYGGLYVPRLGKVLRYGKVNAYHQPVTVGTLTEPFAKPWQAECDYQIFAVPGQSGQHIGLVEQWEPIALRIDRIVEDLRRCYNSFVAQGYSYDRSALAGMMVAGETLELEDIVKFHKMTGSVIVNRKSDGYEMATGGNVVEPIRPLPNGLDPSVQALQQSLLFELDQMYRLAGISSIMQGQILGSEVGKGVTMAAMQGAENALHPFYMADLALFRKTTEFFAYHAWEQGLVDGYVPDERVYQIKVNVLPTEEKWAMIRELQGAGIREGKLTMLDALDIEMAPTLEDARQRLYIRAKQGERKLAESQAQGMEQNAAVQQQSAQLAAEQKLQLEQIKGQMRLLEAQAKGREQRQTALVQAAVMQGLQSLPAQISQMVQQAVAQALAMPAAEQAPDEQQAMPPMDGMDMGGQEATPEMDEQAMMEQAMMEQGMAEQGMMDEQALAQMQGMYGDEGAMMGEDEEAMADMGAMLGPEGGDMDMEGGYADMGMDMPPMA